jgi:lipopolysaccharide transport system permease protein
MDNDPSLSGSAPAPAASIAQARLLERAAVHEINPPGRWSPVKLNDLWQYRELLYFLALRDVKVRYKQAFIGFTWAILQPVFMMAVFTLFLGHLAGIKTPVPYPVFAFAGLIPWLFFSNAVTGASDSLVTNANLVSKVYFPRLVIPLASVLSWLPDVGIALVVLIGLMAILGIAPAVSVVFLPLFVVLVVVTALAASLWLSALNVAYRDIHYAAPFFLQLGLFATPVTYPASLVPHAFRSLFALNPMAGVVEGFRWALVGNGPAPWALVAESALVAGVILVAGLLYFRRVEQFFADVI